MTLDMTLEQFIYLIPEIASSLTIEQFQEWILQFAEWIVSDERNWRDFVAVLVVCFIIFSIVVTILKGLGRILKLIFFPNNKNISRKRIRQWNKTRSKILQDIETRHKERIEEVKKDSYLRKHELIFDDKDSSNDKWPDNPKLMGDMDLSMLNNDSKSNSPKISNLSYEINLACPICDGILRKRLNKVTGIFFYGCNNFPECRYEASDMADIPPPKCVSEITSTK